MNSLVKHPLAAFGTDMVFFKILLPLMAMLAYY